jgi:hypothetical protein
VYVGVSAHANLFLQTLDLRLPLKARKSSLSVGPVTPITTAAPNGPKSEDRTAKSDKVNIEVTGDKTRDKCVELLYDGLACDSAACEIVFIRRFVHLANLSLGPVHSCRIGVVTSQSSGADGSEGQQRCYSCIQGKNPIPVRELEGQEQPNLA